MVFVIQILTQYEDLLFLNFYYLKVNSHLFIIRQIVFIAFEHKYKSAI